LNAVGKLSASTFRGVISKNFLALHWRERIEVRVVPAMSTLTLALSRKRARGNACCCEILSEEQ
jgi:hypothetical protein